ncbi:MAG: VPLPA-CTERM sorting domain-containing protein [Pseudomonadota bacterium]
MRSLTLSAVVAATSFVLAASASAASLVVSGNSVLDTGAPVDLEFSDVAEGAFDETVDFDVAAGVADTHIRISLDRDEANIPPLVQNFDFELVNAADNSVIILLEDVTDATGEISSFPFSLETIVDLTGITDVIARFAGTSVASAGGALPDINVTLTAVPVPAALPLFLAGLGGFGLASRKRRKV